MANWNWTVLCGRGQGTFLPWSKNDFGHCFEKLVFACITHAILAVTSIYHFGKYTYSVSVSAPPRHWIIHIRCIISLLLFTAPLFFSLLTTVYLHLSLSWIDIGSSCITSAAWLLHTLYVWRLNYLYNLPLRGPIVPILSVLLTFASVSIQLRTVILHDIHHSGYLNVVEEYITYLTFGLIFFYLVTLIPSRRHGPQQPGSYLSIQASHENEALLSRPSSSYGTYVHLEENEDLGVAEDGSNCLSQLFFCWVNPLMYKGSKGKLSHAQDLFHLPKSIQTSNVESQFKAILEQYKQQKQSSASNHYPQPDCENGDQTRPRVPRVTFSDEVIQCQEKMKPVSLIRALHRAFGCQFYSIGILKLLADLLGFAGPLLLNLLVSYMESKTEPVKNGYLYAGGLFLSTFLVAMISTHFNYLMQVKFYNSF